MGHTQSCSDDDPTMKPFAPTLAQIIAALQRNSVFSNTDDPTLVALAEVAQPRAYKAKDVIFRQGDPGDEFYVIHGGTIRVCRESTSGPPVELVRRHAPESFGELALLDGGTRTATIQAVTRCTLLAIPRDDFLDALHSSRETTLGLLGVVGRMLREATLRGGLMVHLNLEGRVAHQLLTLTKVTRLVIEGQPWVNVRQAELAQMVGASRQRVNKTLKHFEEQGYLEIGPTGIAVLEPDALTELAAH